MTEDILKIQDEIDYQFMLRVQQEVTQSCALPFALPIERIHGRVEFVVYDNYLPIFQAIGQLFGGKKWK